MFLKNCGKIYCIILFVGGFALIEVYIDGASAGDPGRSGAGVFIKFAGKVERYSIPLGMMSNHEAEFHALIKALEICLEKGYTTIAIRTDSQLIDRAIEKNHTKSAKFAPLLHKANELINQFDFVFVKWVSSQQNKTADVLARRAIHHER
jgi:ribonuclease HI